MRGAPVRIVVNGEDQQLPDGTTVGELVDRHARSGRAGVAVAVNGQVVRRAAMDDTELVEGDTVELVGAVQGGAM